MRMRVTAVVAVVVVAAGSLLAGGTAHADEFQGKWLRNDGDAQCLDIATDGGETIAVTRPCGREASQRWTTRPAGWATQIINRQTGNCLQVRTSGSPPAPAMGSPIDLRPCGPPAEAVDQQFRVWAPSTNKLRLGIQYNPDVPVFLVATEGQVVIGNFWESDARWRILSASPSGPKPDDEGECGIQACPDTE